MKYISAVEHRAAESVKSHDILLESQERQELQKQYGIFEEYLLQRQPPVAPGRNKINVQARQYWTEMSQKGIPIDKIFHSVKDGWIFGCDDDWQTMVMYVLCRDPSAHARARVIYTDLNRDFKFYCLWAIGYLRRNESMLLKMNYDISLLPDPINVITDYLNILADNRVLMSPIGRDYEKRFICGDRFLRK
jgi:hypothetical protein